MMTENTFLTLQAFLQALDKLESPLEESLVEDINAVGRCLSGDRKGLIVKIENACDQNTNLKNLFEEYLSQLGENYQLAERQKAKPPVDDDGAIVPNVTDNKLIRLGQILEDKNPIEKIKQEKTTQGNAWCEILELFMR